MKKVLYGGTVEPPETRREEEQHYTYQTLPLLQFPLEWSSGQRRREDAEFMRLRKTELMSRFYAKYISDPPGKIPFHSNIIL